MYTAARPIHIHILMYYRGNFHMIGILSKRILNIRIVLSHCITFGMTDSNCVPYIVCIARIQNNKEYLNCNSDIIAMSPDDTNRVSCSLYSPGFLFDEPKVQEYETKNVTLY